MPSTTQYFTKLRNKKLQMFLLLLCFFATPIHVLAAEEPAIYSEYETSSYSKALALKEAGLFSGVNTESFDPALDQMLTREQAMKIILITLEISVSDSAQTNFTDVSGWAIPYVAKASSLGITNGISANKFGGTNMVTLRELFTFYLRAMGYDSSDAYQNTYDLASNQGIIGNFKETDLNRKAYREDVVMIAYDVVSDKYEDTLNYKFIDGELENTDIPFWTLTALAGGDFEKLQLFMHPTKGTVFSATPFIDMTESVQPMPNDLLTLTASSEKFVWGIGEATGEPIELSFAEYYHQYITSVNYRESYIEVNYGLIPNRGNASLNYKELFPTTIAVEYFYPGTETYEGLDYSSLILVFEKYEESYYLVAVMNSYWTP